MSARASQGRLGGVSCCNQQEWQPREQQPVDCAFLYSSNNSPRNHAICEATEPLARSSYNSSVANRFDSVHSHVLHVILGESAAQTLRRVFAGGHHAPL